jgi:hypothetical protein
MEAEINKEILESLVKEVETITPSAFPAGLMDRRIREMGSYEEAGLRFEYNDYAVGQLYAGLGVLARDMYQYLSGNQRNDAALFKEVISLVNTEERKTHGDQAFPNYVGLPVEDLPQQLAFAAALGWPTVEPLGKRDIVREWTFKPGKRLFVKFGAKFKETICGKDGPYDQFNNGLLGQAALPSTIASTILIAGFSPATFWYPLAVYMSILLLETGLKTYCELD